MGSAVRRVRKAQEGGQGVAYVLIIGAVLLVFVTAIVSILSKEMKWLVGTQKRSVLLAAADGGIDRAMYALQVGGNWDNLPKAIVPGYNQDVTYTDVPGIRYTINVQSGNWTPGYEIGDDKLDRTITVFASNTISGEQRKVQVVISQSTLNSALFSGGQISIIGHASIHWGPVVSYSTATDSIPLNTTTPPNNPIFESVGGITFSGVRKPQYESENPSAGLFVWPFNQGLMPMPVVDVNFLRSQAQGQGRWYGGSCAAVTPSPINSALSPATTDSSITFYDTCSGVNYDHTIHTPCSGNSCSGNAIGADIKTTGNFCGSGIFVVEGNLDMAGNGCTLGVNLIPPPDCYPKYDYTNADCAQQTNPADLTWNGGFIYVAGTLSYNGNIKIYGTIDAEQQSASSGSMAIYYKTSNKQLGLLGKSILQKVWLERAPQPGEVFP